MKKQLSFLFLVLLTSTIINGSFLGSTAIAQLAEPFEQCSLNPCSAGTFSYGARYVAVKTVLTLATVSKIMGAPSLKCWPFTCPSLLPFFIRFLPAFISTKTLLSPLAELNKCLIRQPSAQELCSPCRAITYYPRFATERISNALVGGISLLSYVCEQLTQRYLFFSAPLISGALPLAAILIPHDKKKQKKLATLLENPFSEQRVPLSNRFVFAVNPSIGRKLEKAEDAIITYLKELQKKPEIKQKSIYYQQKNLKAELATLLSRWWDPLRRYRLISFFWKNIGLAPIKNSVQKTLQETDIPSIPPHKKTTLKKLIKSLDPTTQEVVASPTLWKKIRKNFEDERKSDPFFYGVHLFKIIASSTFKKIPLLNQFLHSSLGLYYSRFIAMGYLLPLSSFLSLPLTLLSQGIGHRGIPLIQTPQSRLAFYASVGGLALLLIACYIGTYRYLIHPFTTLANHETTLLTIMAGLKKYALLHTQLLSILNQKDSESLAEIKRILLQASTKNAQIQLFIRLIKNKDSVQNLCNLVEQTNKIKKEVEQFSPPYRLPFKK